MLPTIGGIYVSYIYVGIGHNQYLGDECKLGGFCAPFGRRVGVCTFLKLYNCNGCILPTFGEHTSVEFIHCSKAKLVRGPTVQFLDVDNWAPDSWAPGELSSRIVVFGPYRALRGENTISKRCVQFTILDSILIFLPNIWVSYQV